MHLSPPDCPQFNLQCLHQCNSMCSLQDYVSVWQIRDALETNRVIPTFVLPFDFRCAGDICPDVRPLRTPYESLVAELRSGGVNGLLQVFNASSTTNITEALIDIIQGAYSVSM